MSPLWSSVGTLHLRFPWFKPIVTHLETRESKRQIPNDAEANRTFLCPSWRTPWNLHSILRGTILPSNLQDPSSKWDTYFRVAIRPEFPGLVRVLKFVSGNNFLHAEVRNLAVRSLNLHHCLQLLMKMLKH